MTVGGRRLGGRLAGNNAHSRMQIEVELPGLGQWEWVGDFLSPPSRNACKSLGRRLRVDDSTPGHPAVTSGGTRRGWLPGTEQREPAQVTGESQGRTVDAGEGGRGSKVGHSRRGERERKEGKREEKEDPGKLINQSINQLIFNEKQKKG
ncbi:hypothetical protein BO82DRAFT_116168 [Aspergillus uvarum CBS 121591]|uniref:Uncharacterized protein n=1 Tax=Aspergillus uvarum CBS 121591 TaxID=1448315 RepID=A0A319CKM2_9EURO|nr:hypothetical protein BO82DRAFT_116168 [Aspergillus uvarum CBS 121591]PYH86125.1 hypothetical protein BO82DRAFT_116168 [Aspergillus uvarum CBS 121591]